MNLKDGINRMKSQALAGGQINYDKVAIEGEMHGEPFKNREWQVNEEKSRKEAQKRANETGKVQAYTRGGWKKFGQVMPEQWQYPKKEADEFSKKLKEFYTDEEISKLSAQELDLIRDFFGRFNNPKPKK